MTNSLIYNSYHVLGLPATASQKDILKRAKELQNLFKIDETPSYDGDLLEAKKIRNEDTVKEALQNLSTPKKRIKEYFFWFQINDAIDEQAFEELKNKSYGDAINIWKSASMKVGGKSFFYKKNLTVLYCLLLSNKNIRQSSYVKNSLALWKELVDEDKFWVYFLQNYKLHDDLNTNAEIIAEFKKQVTLYLADIYTEISQLHEDNNFFSEFTAIFGVKGEKAQSDIVNPIYNNIRTEVAKLDKINVIEGQSSAPAVLTEVKSVVQNVQIQLNKLIDLGLYEDSETKTLRDKIAGSIRSIVLDLYNNGLEKGEKTFTLLNIAQKISGSVGMEHQIQGDINILNNNQRFNRILEPLNKLIEEKKFQEALDFIQSHLPSDNKDLEQALNNQKKLVITLFAHQKYKIGQDESAKTHYDTAQNLFADGGDLIYENLELFTELNPEGVKSLLKQVKEMVAASTKKNLNNLDTWRANLTKSINEKFGENNIDKYTLNVLIDCYMWGGLMPLFRKIRHNNQVANVFYTIGWITVWYYGVGIIAFIIGAVYANKD